MASGGNDRFLLGLVHLLQNHPDEDDVFQARSALMWLCVAQRPLRAHELSVALQIERSQDVQHIERLLTEPAYADEEKAAKSLQGLLGDLIALKPDSKDASKIFVQLRDPELRTFLQYLPDLVTNAPEPILSFACPPAQAHIFVASVCMTICSVSALHLAHVHDKDNAAALMLYAWTHWNTHLSLSQFTLDNASAAGLFDQMAFYVCTDILVFLLSLNEFVTGPIVVPSTEDRASCVALVKQAQMALERPIVILSALVQHEGYSQTLHTARLAFQTASPTSPTVASAAEGPQAPLLEDPSILSRAPTASSSTEILKIDSVMLRSEKLFNEQQRQMVRGFAELARSLRALTIPLVQSPLYEELLTQCQGVWSPMDILVNAADWMESVAGYAYWREIPNLAAHSAFVVPNTSDPNYHAAALVVRKLKQDGVGTPSKTKPKFDGPPRNPSAAPAGISATHWYATRAVYKLKAWRSGTPLGSTFVINDVRLMAHRTTSFATHLPKLQASGDMLPSVQIPSSLKRLYRKRLSPFLARMTNWDVFTAMNSLGSILFAENKAETWASVKTFLLQDGWSKTFLYFVIAIVMTHLRQFLFPWLGTFMYYRPLADLRMALSNPDIFLEEALSIRWFTIGFSIFNRYCFTVMLLMLMNLAVSSDGRLPPDWIDVVTRLQREAPGLYLWALRGRDLLKVAYLTLMFTVLEYAFDRTVNTISFMIALSKLVFGTKEAQLALTGSLGAHWDKALFNGWQLFYYVVNSIIPIVFGATLSAACGQPGFLIVVTCIVGIVTALIRYRSTFYLVIELSGLFIFGGLLLASSLLLAVEFVKDPLSLGTNTSSMRNTANRARAVLPTGAQARSQILSRQAALPVSRPGPPRAVRSTQAAVEDEKQD
jgi:hypothetical protein